MSLDKPERYWRIFYTAPRAEMRCEQRLQDRGLEVFLPKTKTRRRWKDRTKLVSEALFRSYIFAHVDERSRLDVLQTKGIVRSVMVGGAIAKLKTEEIEQLKITQQDPERLALLTHWLPTVGSTVLVTDGPMKGLRGEVLQHRGQAYVVIRIQALRQAVKVNVPLNGLEALNETIAA